ncbi:Sialic acid TRAP transporter permease protein SiaT [Nymphon striatum]|nr:Sialic acid TRAP transporter permease protein SiaT [Nymphon striatum]
MIVSNFDTNIKSIDSSEDRLGIGLAIIGVVGLLSALVWSGWRAFKIEDTLRGVMVETAKTTSLVFIILLGAAMLTAAFRAFGGEELVKHFLEGLPGGFWTKFVIVMAVIFILGFFLDFIEIAVVVVPIVAPILLSDPSANITAVWLGVMIGLNIQTSFLTPPFGFALFYLRGVAPATVKTLAMYKGVIAFIGLQIVALIIVGVYPTLQFAENGSKINNAIDLAGSIDVSVLPKKLAKDFKGSLEEAGGAMELLTNANSAEAVIQDASIPYRPLHEEVRQIQRDIRFHKAEIKELQIKSGKLRGDENASKRDVIAEAIKVLEAEIG